MTEPTTPDLSFSGLLDSLPDNNSGSITPQKVRSIAALSRPLRATVGTGVVPSSYLNSAFDGRVLADRQTVQIARLAKLLTAEGVSSYAHYSGTAADSSAYLQMLQSAAANLGIQYVNPGGQPRTFDYEWDLLLRSSTRTFWAVTFYYLPNGSSWPTDPVNSAFTGSLSPSVSPTSASWNDVKIHHSDAMYGSSSKIYGSGTTWQAHSAGKRSITLNPGDTIVPILEYWGEEDNGSLLLSEQDTSVVKWSMAVTSTGVAPDNWDDDPDYWTTVNNRDKAVFDLTDVAVVSSSTGVRVGVTVTNNAAGLPTTPVKGELAYRTDTNSLLSYTSAVTGWTQPWNMPWGRVASGVMTSWGGGALSSQALNPPVTLTGMSVTFTAVRNRNYKFYFYTSFGNPSTPLTVTVYPYLAGPGYTSGLGYYGSQTHYTAGQYTGVQQTFMISCVDGAALPSYQFPPGNTTYYLTGHVSAGSIGINLSNVYPWTLWVEDVGPAYPPA